MIDLPKYNQAAHIKQDVAELVEFIEECHKLADERPEMAERLRAVADEQSRRIPGMAAYIRGMAHVYCGRREPK